MELNGTYDIAAPRLRVWQLLHTPSTMQQCIPGCEELSDLGKGVLRTKLRLKISPISMEIGGKLFVSDLQKPESFTITSKRKGKPVSVAKLRLIENSGKTTVHYHIVAEVSGKLAWLRGPIVSPIVKKFANEFFSNLAEVA